MRESGWYPPGAEHDPRAPWNQPDPIECPRCGGTGTEVDLTAEDPDDREFPCWYCEGTGVACPDEYDLEYEE